MCFQPSSLTALGHFSMDNIGTMCWVAISRSFAKVALSRVALLGSTIASTSFLKTAMKTLNAVPFTGTHHYNVYHSPRPRLTLV